MPLESSEPSPEAIAQTDVSSLPSWTIEPWTEGLVPRMREAWQYRRLVVFFGLKALQKMYKRTKLGKVWLLIRPLFPLAVQAVIFGGLLGVGSEGLPYFLFLVTATAVWQLFATSVMWGTRSLELNRSLISKIYLPRLILPLSMMSPAYLTFAIYLCVLAATLLWYGLSTGEWYFIPSFRLIWSVVASLMAVALAFSIALWTSVPALVYRDVRFTVGYVLGFWVYLTPVLYPLSIVDERWQRWMLLNPMAPIVEAFKYGVLGIGSIQAWQLGVAAVVVAVIFGSGLAFFSRAEADAADRV